MKKGIIIACLALFSLVSCSNNAKTEEKQPVKVVNASKITAEATTEPITTAEITTEAEIPAATEPEEDKLIFNEQGFEVYFQKVDTNIIDLYIVNPVENLPVWAYISNITVNNIGIDINPIELYVPVNTSTTCHAEIPLEELQKQEISKINDLKFDLSVKSGDTLIDKIEGYTITR